MAFHNSKDPFGYDFYTYIWVIFIAAWGGIVGVLSNKENGGKNMSVTMFTSTIIVSSFVGVMTFYVCEALKIPAPANAAMIGIMGNLGASSLEIIRNLLFRRFLNKNGK